MAWVTAIALKFGLPGSFTMHKRGILQERDNCDPCNFESLYVCSVHLSSASGEDTLILARQLSHKGGPAKLI